MTKLNPKGAAKVSLQKKRRTEQSWKGKKRRETLNECSDALGPAVPARSRLLYMKNFDLVVKPLVV